MPLRPGRCRRGLARAIARVSALALIASAPVLTLLPLFETTACAPTKSAPVAPAPIIIGVSLGLTGSLASISAPLKNATKVAEVQINALGGLFGRPVELRVIDDTSDEMDVVRQRVTTLLDQGAVALLGPVGSQQVKATQDILNARKVIQISPSATSPDLTAIQPALNRYLFRTAPSDDLQGKAVVLFAYRGPPVPGSDGGASDSGMGKLFCSRMAVVHIDNSYGNAMAAVIEQFFPKRGGTIVLDLKVGVTPADNYKTEVGMVIAAKPDCLALISYDDVGDVWMRDLLARQTDLPANFPVIGTDGLYTAGFITNGRIDQTMPTSPTNAEGVYGTNPDTNPPTAEFAEFANLYSSLFPLDAGAQPAPFTASIYDAAMLTILAIAQAGTASDGQKIRDALFKVSKTGTTFGPAELADALEGIQNGVDIDYKGASGDVDFDDNGDVLSDYIVWRVVNGAFSDPPLDRIHVAELEAFQ